MTWRSVFLTLAMLILTAPVTSYGAEASDPVIEAAALSGDVMFMESGAPGMVLTIVRNGQSTVLGYGETEKGNGKQPDDKTLLRLNSITKVFLGEVAAALAAEGRLSLSDPLQKYSGNMKVPASGGRQVTLLDLATHTAAMPRELDGMPEGANPRAWPTRLDRWKWLPGYKLPWVPGSIASYSNVGFDLLADAVETATGKVYPALLKQYVTAPLGMADTVLTPTAEQCARLMTGSGLGGTFPCGDTHATGGSGGLYSTGSDMGRWLVNELANTDGALDVTHAMYRQRQALKAAIGFDEAGPMVALGMGWVMVAGDGIKPMLLTKSGGGLGFMSYMVMAPGRDVAVFVVVNRADFAMFGDITRMVNGLVANLVIR